MAAGDITDAMVLEIRSRIGEAATSGLSDAEVLYAINNAQYDLGERLCDAAMPEMTKTVTGSFTANKIALPADCWRPRALAAPAGTWAIHRPITQLYAIGDTGVQAPSATDVIWYVWYNTSGAYIITDGCPGTSPYVLYYVTMPVTATTSVDPLYWAPRLELVKEFALAELLRLRQRFDEWQAIYQGYLYKIALINSRFRDGMAYDGLPGDPKGA